MRIKLIAIDIDGTLLDSKGNLSNKNKKAIQEAQELDIKIILFTGRPYHSAKEILDKLDLSDKNHLIVTNNGGLIQESKTGKIIHESTFTRAEILDVYQLSQKLKMPLNLIDSDYVYEPDQPIGFESIYTGGKSSEKNNLKFVDLDMGKLTKDFRVNQIIMSRPETELDAILPKIPENYFEKYNIYKSLSFILEFLPKDVDKGNSLDRIRAILALEKDEIMAIGDQENDLSLLEKAGLGIAMGNAVKEVKETANYITKSNDRNGLAYAIRKFVL